MTKTIDIEQVKISIQALVALRKNGDEVILEENGEPVGKVVPFTETAEPYGKKRILGLGSGKGYFMNEDFDDELPDEFWGFDKE